MTEQHPITPPAELVQQWRDLPEFTDGRRKMIMVTLSREKLLDIATQAARWGADQELEACCEWIGSEGLAGYTSRELRAARRPESTSLKEQGLKALDSFEGFTGSLEEIDIIRRALESIPD